MEERSLFDDLHVPLAAASLPEGLVYESNFLAADEAAELEHLMAELPLENAFYKGHTARRRVSHYGSRFNYDSNQLMPATPLIEQLHPLRRRVAHWMGVTVEALEHVLVSEYSAGTPLGWHRDAPQFEDVAGVSLGAQATLRFRPYPPSHPRRSDIRHLCVEPRSIYLLHGPARWKWQHSVAAVTAKRWSITFRTVRGKGADGSPQIGAAGD